MKISYVLIWNTCAPMMKSLEYKSQKCTAVAFLSAPEMLTCGRCKSDECPFIMFYPLETFSHDVCDGEM